ncbi:TetR/AcrR family transcriptional regulator [Nocardia brasiliensis]|uniref:TetR/AcrR family transcriptional regulator n=1 Tax=Nocardia brasiliensis TaxID=37326 RepID=UPI003D8D834B
MTATRAILEEGDAELLTMAAVARRAGVSRRAVYLHFASRAELLTSLFGFVNEAESLAASLDAVWQAVDADAALEEWARHIARFHPHVLAIARAIQRVRRIDPDAEEHWQLVAADQYACCRRLVARLSDEGRLAVPWTVESGADMMWALMSFEMLEELLVDRGWSVERFRVHLAALLAATFLDPAHRRHPDQPPTRG